MPVLIENTAGGDNAVVRRVESIARLWAEVGDLGPGFVLDTCHAWAGGEPGDELVGRVHGGHRQDRSRPLQRLPGHLRLARRDRHANLGHGLMPLELLATVVEQAGAPVVVETPGGVAEHMADMAFVREHVSKAGITCSQCAGSLIALALVLGACAFNQYGPWLDESGQPLEGSQVLQYQGFEECGHEDVVFLSFFGRMYAQDEDGVLGRTPQRGRRDSHLCNPRRGARGRRRPEG